MTTNELQSEIKKLIKKIGWSLPKLSDVIYTAMHDEFEYDEDEALKFREKIKKQLSRKSTTPEILENYLHIISQDRKVERHEIIIPVYIKSKYLDSEMVEKMRSISRGITKSLVDKNDL